MDSNPQPQKHGEHGATRPMHTRRGEAPGEFPETIGSELGRVSADGRDLDTDAELPPPPRPTPRVVSKVAATLLNDSGRQASARPSPTTLANYTIIEKLGCGALGVVYRARHHTLKREVALRVFEHPDHAGPDALRCFHAEAMAVARLRHPNIVQIYEVGEENDCVFLALEFVGGGTLAAALQGNPQPIRRAAETAEALAQAIQWAHVQGVLHLDLKPSNVLLTADGVPKVADFGFVRQLTLVAPADSPSQAEPAPTQTGLILGTAGYMAPEQTYGGVRPVGPAADIYALGAILYEMLTGRPPFQEAASQETVQKIRSEEVIFPRQLRATIPCDLETICLRCLEREPVNRYSAARELASDLRRFLTGEPMHARPE